MWPNLWLLYHEQAFIWLFLDIGISTWIWARCLHKCFDYYSELLKFTLWFKPSLTCMVGQLSQVRKGDKNINNQNNVLTDTPNIGVWHCAYTQSQSPDTLFGIPVQLLLIKLSHQPITGTLLNLLPGRIKQFWRQKVQTWTFRKVYQISVQWMYFHRMSLTTGKHSHIFFYCMET